jgi:hypothetical protein
MILYQQIDVWKRLDGERLCRYRCLRLEPAGTYVVQSADFLSVPVDLAAVNMLDTQFHQLLAEEAPEVRGETYATLGEAIAAHDREFEN